MEGASSMHPNESRTRAQPRVALERVSKTFHEEITGSSVLAVDDVSLCVAKSEFRSIVGPSGCGKSTVLNIIAGLEHPSEGHILIDGVEENVRHHHFGYMFQNDLLFPWRRVRDNVAIGLETLGTPRRATGRRRFFNGSTSIPSPTSIRHNCRAVCASGWL